MPPARRVGIRISDLTLVDPEGHDVSLSSLTGVHVLVLIRHRH